MNTKVAVAGCGFAGLTAARNLSKHKNIDLTLIDRKNDFSFKPLLADVIGDRVPADALLFHLGGDSTMRCLYGRPASKPHGGRSRMVSGAILKDGF